MFFVYAPESRNTVTARGRDSENLILSKPSIILAIKPNSVISKPDSQE